MKSFNFFRVYIYIFLIIYFIDMYTFFCFSLGLCEVYADRPLTAASVFPRVHAPVLLVGNSWALLLISLN